MEMIESIIRNDLWTLVGSAIALITVASIFTKDRSKPVQAAGNVAAVVAAVGLTALTGAWFDRMVGKSTEDSALRGTFSITGAQLGNWSAAPSRCLDGSERGFEGVLFEFDSGVVRELRLDNTPRRKTVALYLDDADGTAMKVKQDECATVAGDIQASQLVVNGRPMRRLHGTIALQCESLGLRGEVVLDGCLPTL